MTRRLVPLIVGAILVVGVAATVLVRHQLRRERAEILGYDKIEEEKATFERNPTVKACATIAEKYMYMGDTENGIRYTQRCLALGGDKRPIAVSFYVWLANMYNKEGKQEQAVAGLVSALSLQTESSYFTEKSIEEFGLQSIYKEAQRLTPIRVYPASRAR